MTSLTNTANTVKKNILPIGVVLLIVFFAVLIIFQFSSPKDKTEEATAERIEAPKIEKLPTSTNRFNTQTLKLPQNIPQGLNVYSKNQSTDFLTKAPFLAGKLNFNQQPTQVEDVIVGTKLDYTQESRYLSVYKNGFSYTDFPQGLPKDGQFKQPEELIGIIKSFLAGLEVNPQFSQNYQVTYQIFDELSESFAETGILQDADRLVIDLNYEITNLKIIGKNIRVYAVFNMQNQLVQIVYNQFLPGDAVGLYPIITTREALQILLGGNGMLIEEKGLDEFSPYPKQFKTVDLKTAYLAYYQAAESSQTLQPVWVFEGTTKVDERDVALTYAVPAINPQYLTNP